MVGVLIKEVWKIILKCHKVQNKYNSGPTKSGSEKFLKKEKVTFFPSVRHQRVNPLLTSIIAIYFVIFSGDFLHCLYFL